MPPDAHLHVPEAALTDLRERLARTRLPDQAPGAAWSCGTGTAFLSDLLGYWQATFDWRVQEAALNAFPQVRTEVAGIGLHALHVPGVGPAPKPLLLLHGWPGSVFEFINIIPRLTDPARFGGDAKDAFTVITPSLPGFGLSFRAGQRRLDLVEMADVLASLMTMLGYERFGTQGGDFGAGISTRLAYAHPDRIIGAHVNMLVAVGRDPSAFPNPTSEERAYLDQLAEWDREHAGYQWMQGTRPQTLAFALTDSPAGLAAWIVEKFRAWSDCCGDLSQAIPRDRMLANIALYWFTGAIGSSFWPYYANRHGPKLIPDGATIGTPFGYAEFPGEILRPPRSAAVRVLTDVRRWSVMPRGGHFAALEQPALLADDIAAFFRELG